MHTPFEADPSVLMRRLAPFCRLHRFDCGELLREAGHYYTDMFMLTEGRIAVARSAGDSIHCVPGSPIGEIGFLRGSAASATCTAETSATAMVIDDPTLARIEHEQPALAADLLRYLSATADERTSFNLTFHGRGTSTGPRTVEAYLCRSREMLESAQRLRYEVYCGELGRISPNADHDKKIITDHLDAKAWIFVAIEDDEVVGTLRGNKSDVGPLGFIEELYGMTASPHHPTATTVATKFIVRKSKRGGVASMKLIAALVRLGLHNNVKECYIDAVPALVPFYEGLGFEITGGSFLHRENGPSYPMKVDLGKHGERLSRETGLI